MDGLTWVYGAFGRAISHLVANESPATMTSNDDSEAFFAYEWVDDHIMIEADEGERCAVAVDVLRLAMLAVLGPEAINDAKLSAWSHELHALGLECRTVSMPRDKILKAVGRVEAIGQQGTVSRPEVMKLLGSLRHVCSCLRAAKPFYQHIATFLRALPRSRRVDVPNKVHSDLTGSWLYCATDDSLVFRLAIFASPQRWMSTCT
jgi:hypothetical protein